MLATTGQFLFLFTASTTKPAEVTCEIWAKPGFNITASPERDREGERNRVYFCLYLYFYVGVYRTERLDSGIPVQRPSPY
jgi:hypothetical protein